MSTVTLVVLYGLLGYLTGIITTKYIFKREKKHSPPLPVGATAYWDAYTGRSCKRCNKGHIASRSRIKVIDIDYNIKKLTTIYWCSGCQYRGVSAD